MTYRLIECNWPPSRSEVRELMGRPRDFSYWGDDDTFRTWALGPVVETRDSDCLQRSNAAAIKAALAPFTDSWRVERCSHWAVGWVDHLSFRVFPGEPPAWATDDTPGDCEPGEVDEVIRVLVELSDRMEDYPALDESGWSELENEECWRFWSGEFGRLLKDGNEETLQAAQEHFGYYTEDAHCPTRDEFKAWVRENHPGALDEDE